MMTINDMIQRINDQIKELSVIVRQLSVKRPSMKKDIVYYKLILKQQELSDKAKQELEYLDAYVQLYNNEINKLRQQLINLNKINN